MYVIINLSINLFLKTSYNIHVTRVICCEELAAVMVSLGNPRTPQEIQVSPLAVAIAVVMNRVSHKRRPIA